jgi:hypothetical protein
VTLEEQVNFVIKALEVKRYEKDTPIFKTALEWIRNFPTVLGLELRRRLLEAFQKAFGVTEAQIYAALEGVELKIVGADQTISNEDKLRSFLPKDGWFRWYDEYTQFNEAPLSYHLFSSLCVLSCALGRKVFVDMGFFKIYPPLKIILVGPPGKVKKTSATDIALELVRECALCPVLPDKITPERLVTALTKTAWQFLCAEELCFFFGRQKYNEGMIPLMLKLLTDRDTIEVETQTREQELISGMAITLLAGTTPSLLSTAVPTELISSGFLSRLIIVHENNTDRKFKIPRIGPNKSIIIQTIDRFKKLGGALSISAEADEWHEEWYNKIWKELRSTTDDLESDMKSRLQIHMLRLAMIIHLVSCDNFRICRRCLETAANLINYAAESAPPMLRAIKQNALAQDTDYVIATLLKLGGAADHSSLLRRVANRMNATQFKQHLRTLEESGRVRIRKRGIANYYVLDQGVSGQDV